MNEDTRKNFVHLNRDGRWSGFRWEGLELLQDGSLQLASLPLLDGETPEEVAALGEPNGPAGIAVDAEGTVYFSDPANHRLMKHDGCDGTSSVVACIGGEGGQPAQFKTPRGLLIPNYRHALMVADSGNHRVQVFDLASHQLVDIWERPAPGAAETGASIFDQPLAMAEDRDANVYVVDSKKVQKFNRAGDLEKAFWERMQSAGAPAKPIGIAAQSQAAETMLYILDRASRSVVVFREDGSAASDKQGQPITFGAAQLQNPMGIAVSADSVYVGDNQRRAVFRFRRGGGHEFIGEAVNYRGPVAALAVDGQGHLLIHAGSHLAPVRLRLNDGFRTRGVLWSDTPIQVKSFETAWLRLRAKLEPLAANARLRLFVSTSDDAAQPPNVDPNSDDPFADANWRPKSQAPDPFAGVADLFIGGKPSRYLWVGAMFSGDGLATPVLTQLRAEYDHQGYLNTLPAIYRNDTCGDFLLRFLSLFETFYNDVEAGIENLSALFDSAAVPKEFLHWLAGWFALELREEWSEQKQREVIASAFQMYSRRGTVAGLREALRVFAGVTAVIEEPILHTNWWGLPAEISNCGGGTNCQCGCGCGKRDGKEEEPVWRATENSVLGVTTMLASAHPQGAVVGSTATLDHSHLISGEQFGAPLFEEVAHRFNVRLYRGQLRCDETEMLARAVIEREKPAHTVYHLCVIEPLMRVGFQARVGIDTVVAGPMRPSKLDGEVRLDREMVLGGPAAGQIGKQSRVGITARVG